MEKKTHKNIKIKSQLSTLVMILHQSLVQTGGGGGGVVLQYEYVLNQYVTRGRFHSYHLDESTFKYKAITSYFSFLFHFSMKAL